MNQKKLGLQQKWGHKFVLVVTIAILMLIVSACTKDTKEPNNEEPKQTATGTDASPIVVKDEERSVVDLSLWSGGITLDNVEGIKNDPVKKFVEDKFKINLKLLTGDLEKIKLLVTTGQSPDIISMPLWLPGANDFLKLSLKEDLFVDIGAMVAGNEDKYPLIAKFMKEPEYRYFNTMFSDDPNSNKAIWIGTYMKGAFGSPIFNMQILNKLNLKLPTTLDEFIHVLREIKKSDPKIIPLGLRNCKGECLLDDLDQIFFNTQGTTAASKLQDANGNWYDSAIDPKNKTVWKQLQDLYKEGLFDKEMFTKDTYYHGTNDFATGKTAAITFAVPNTNDGLYRWAVDEFIKANPTATYQDVQMLPHALTGPGGTAISRNPAFNVLNGIVIPKSNKNPERALEYIEWTLSNEGQTAKFYGIEGVHYKKNAEGKPELISVDEWKKVTDVWAIDGNHGMFWAYMYAQGGKMDYENNSWFEAHVKQTFPIIERIPETPQSKYYNGILETWKQETFKEIDFYNGFANFSPEYLTIDAKLKEIKSKYFNKFFVGELDVDKNWDAFVKEYQDAGLSAYITEYTRGVKEAKEKFEAAK
ncbi:extracellular solute-binding protein [Paenibacillus eucommiae]|uniref:ABC-type glycerol-3-phosphate transport system substrate-binding protein n=1 Tax=Paenibacillus eucommiae TaxID=1355755 RepID=A0ABS4ITD4_9BACL|nr:extracellular solute-binding protein [Paenibacillus eucommiae]MBP1990833.1 ABC-type glycerol-3-phosphate transport system substrate-binding protein [Paenibacillus eucommiae]